MESSRAAHGELVIQASIVNNNKLWNNVPRKWLFYEIITIS